MKRLGLLGDMPVRRAAAYYVIAFSLALGIALFGQSMGEGAALLTMFTPLAAVLVMKLAVTRDGYSLSSWKELCIHRPGFRFWPLALVLPALALLPGYALLWGSDVARLTSEPWAADLRTVIKFVIGIFIAAVLGGIGEEIGWRGYLLPHLMKLGQLRASIATGFLHGVWHLPLLLLTPFYHQDGNRWIVVALFLVALTAAGPVYGWFRIASGSIWPAAILHAALNDWWDLFDKAAVTDSRVVVEYVAGESGVVAIAMYVILAVLAWRSTLYRGSGKAPGGNDLNAALPPSKSSARHSFRKACHPVRTPL